MSAFTDAEAAYLNSQPLGRLATVGPDGRPHVTPVGVIYDAEATAIVIGSADDIRPRRILAWGIDGGSFDLSARNVA